MTSSFHDTRWTLIARSCGDDTAAKAALSDLCAAYYAPVVAFLRRGGRTDDAARELAHAFFARLLEGGALGGAEPARGRFRNYLLGALKHFAADQRDRVLTARRGGGQTAVPLEADDPGTGAGLQIADVNTESPDRAFDRQWALTVLARALETLELEMGASGKAEHFMTLKPCLTSDAEPLRQSAAATALGMSEDAVKMAIHRLRRRFRDAVKAEIAQTVEDPEQVRAELDALTAALRG